MTDTQPPARIWAAKEHNADDWDAGTFCAVDDGGVEYVRADVVSQIEAKLKLAIQEYQKKSEYFDFTLKVTGYSAETIAMHSRDYQKTMKSLGKG